MSTNCGGVEIRQELGAILDKLRVLPQDAFVERSQLAARQQQLRAELGALPIEGAAEIGDRWNDLA